MRDIDRTQTSATAPSQSEHGSNDNEGALYIPQLNRTWHSPSDGFVSYQGT